MAASFVVLLLLIQSVASFVPYGRQLRVSSSHSPFISKAVSESLSLGAPTARPRDGSYISAGNIQIEYKVESVNDPDKEVSRLVDQIDGSHGVLLQSSYEYPGRYTRWTVGFSAPALIITGRQLGFKVEALNDRGKLIQDMILLRLKEQKELFEITLATENGFAGQVIPSDRTFPEEERSRQVSAAIDISYSA